MIILLDLRERIQNGTKKLVLAFGLGMKVCSISLASQLLFIDSFAIQSHHRFGFGFGLGQCCCSRRNTTSACLATKTSFSIFKRAESISSLLLSRSSAAAIREISPPSSGDGVPPLRNAAYRVTSSGPPLGDVARKEAAAVRVGPHFSLSSLSSVTIALPERTAGGGALVLP